MWWRGGGDKFSNAIVSWERDKNQICRKNSGIWTQDQSDDLVFYLTGISKVLVSNFSWSQNLSSFSSIYLILLGTANYHKPSLLSSTAHTSPASQLNLAYKYLYQWEDGLKNQPGYSSQQRKGCCLKWTQIYNHWLSGSMLYQLSY